MKMIQDALQGGSIEGIGAKAKGGELQVSDYMVEIELTADSTPQDIMVAAMQMEKKAFDFYSGLLAGTGDRNSRPSSPGSAGGGRPQRNSGKRIRDAFFAVDVSRCAAVTSDQ